MVAWSSVEAELNALVKSVTENMMKESGRDPKGQILMDSSAANGIVHRPGCGKVKHLECRQLRVQGIVGEGKVTCTKVPRLNNRADALTHCWSYEDGRRHFSSKPKLSIRQAVTSAGLRKMLAHLFVFLRKCHDARWNTLQVELEGKYPNLQLGHL